MLTQVRNMIVEEKAVEGQQRQRVRDTKQKKEMDQHETATGKKK